MSFILDSALESLEQSLWHWKVYKRTNDSKQLRFTIIHLDCAVELIVKEYIKGLDRILYEKDRKSLDLSSCIKSLRRSPVELLNTNEILFLHEIRNNTQHLGLRPAEDQVSQIIIKVLTSIRSFLKVSFNIDLKPLEKALDESGEKRDPSYIYLDHAEAAYNAGLFETAFLSKIIVLELEIRKLFPLTPKPMKKSGQLG
ncbi:MAG: hypothetical protein ACFFC7_10530 [Candidatus Hermodarchaeota archaeon]